MGVVVVKLQGNAKSYSPTFLNAMAGLMGVPRVRQALIALKPVERERVGGYARYCLKFQRDDLTAEVRMYVGAGFSLDGMRTETCRATTSKQ